MKTLKRISLTTLVLVMVLAAVLAIPASALGTYRGYFSQKCECDGVFYGHWENRATIGSSVSYAKTVLDHMDSPECTSGSVYASAKFWHYPSSSSSAYNTTTVYSSDQGKDASCTANQTSSVGEIFCVESNHTATTVCNGTTYTYNKYYCNGSPAMK